ncbi:thiamine pyrophosphate-dependent enzyme [Sphingomonas solaris]|uniref:Pyruvate dehydrogenase n=1 Tax=Alterirhizorhabdus solaris TaxID=2529389 RepID=A0A558R333_9SPHN|nr:thiamine pyrophosphate-dependent enzyme [Sphingomonas solaris]TVV73786.1 pyruvate dehydrogenase [Sphingomonas solaris]
MAKTVADSLVATLADLGVRQIFGVVGDALNPLTDAIRRQDVIEWIGVRHEEGAALAAAGQAKLTGRLGVCCGTTGPGGNHLVAGLYEARKDHAPVLAISGGVPAEHRGTDYLQEDTPDLLFRDVSAYTQTVTAPEQAAPVFRQAIAEAYGQRGVAHLNLPPDVIGAKMPEAVASVPTLRPRPQVSPDPADIQLLAREIDAAGKIAIFAGEGCRGAIEQVFTLADRLNAPVVHTFRAKDMAAYDHPRWIGGVGLIGGAPGVDALNDADLVLMLGSDYPYTEFLPQDGRVIQIDERAAVLGRRAAVRLGVVGSVGPALNALTPIVAAKTDTAFFDKATKARVEWDAMLDKRADPARSADRIHPPALGRMLGDMAARDAVFVVDTGEITLWSGNWLRQTGQQRILASFNNAAVGTALGQANGVSALNRDRQVIAVCGDGGFTMQIGEFMTAVEHKLPVKVVVYNNSGWGLVDLEMNQAGLPASSGAKFPNMDFAAFARACGVEGFTARKPAELAGAIAGLLASPGPAVLDVFVDPDELPTMPHIEPLKAARFGIGKIREILLGG